MQGFCTPEMNSGTRLYHTPVSFPLISPFITSFITPFLNLIAIQLTVMFYLHSISEKIHVALLTPAYISVIPISLIYQNITKFSRLM